MIDRQILFDSIIKLIELHPQIVNSPTFRKLGEDWNYSFEISFQIKVPLPSKFLDQGITDKGVKEIEDCHFFFPDNFPISPLRIGLRKDFPRSFPHINPGGNDFVNPCIYDGNFSDLIFHPEWFNEVLDHLVTWLSKAARDDLLDYEQGWEPIRRDKDSSKLLFDEDEIKSQIQSSKSMKTRVFDFEYRSSILQDDNIYFYGSIFNEKNLRSNIDQVKIKTRVDEIASGNTNHHHSIGIIGWSDRKSICEDYHPDTVETIGDLIARAEEYGCDISYQLRTLAGLIQHRTVNDFYVVILAVRRPINLIGSSSNIELISYLIRTKGTEGFEITPITNIYKANSKALSNLSGIEIEDPELKIGLIGVGSLGSKIGLHLARSGFPSFDVFDKGELLPHNQARHALIHRKWDNLKAFLFAMFVEQMGTKVVPHIKDLRYWLPNNNLLNKSSQYSVLIDSTASDEVSIALSSLDADNESVPLVQTRLYSEAKMATLSTEGLHRNPRNDDIEAILITCAIDDIDIKKFLFGDSVGSYDQIRIGEGCHSSTLKMSDARLSIFAAGMSERISSYIRYGFPEQGELLVGLLDEHEMGAKWLDIPLPKFEQHITNDGWFVRIASNIIDDMRISLQEHSPNETGGVLVGNISWATHTIIITKTLPAPEDSKRSSTTFELGTKGLKEKIEKIHNSTNNHLTYVGTWHSHPAGGLASRTDKDTLIELTQERTPIPTVCLIMSDQISLVPGNAV